MRILTPFIIIIYHLSFIIYPPFTICLAINMSKINSNLKNIKKILLATHNPSKVKRFQLNLKIDSVKFLSPQDLNLAKIDVEENGEDEFVNSQIKAKAYFTLSNDIPCLSLDTGFYIEGLPTEQQPAKHVQRIAGVLDTDSDQTRFEKMTNYYRQIARDQGGEAKAYFKDVFCLFDGIKTCFQVAKREALLTDFINQKDVNFPIASIYKVPTFNKYYHDLNQQEMLEYIKPSLDAVKKFFLS